MKVKNTATTVSFGSISFGSTFVFNDVVYIKMCRELRTQSGSYNSVRLSSGEPLYIMAGAEVIPREFKAVPV